MEDEIVWALLLALLSMDTRGRHSSSAGPSVSLSGMIRLEDLSVQLFARFVMEDLLLRLLGTVPP